MHEFDFQTVQHIICQLIQTKSQTVVKELVVFEDNFGRFVRIEAKILFCIQCFDESCAEGSVKCDITFDINSFLCENQRPESDTSL